jgi:hypothetical protein
MELGIRNPVLDPVLVFKKCCSSKGKGCAPTILAKPKIMASTQEVVSSLAFFLLLLMMVGMLTL